MLIKLSLIFFIQSIFEISYAKINQTSLRFTRSVNQQCGVPTQSTSLVIGGNNFQRGTWPWMVALMQKETTPPKLFCGGVLVSTTKVLTGEKVYKFYS